MKPISLTIEAFGPYRDSVTLDSLTSSRPFHVSHRWPQRGRKTSILDAMVYALVW